MFVKYSSNVEKMKNYLTLSRVEDSKSDEYALMEDSFIQIGNGEGNGKAKEMIFKMDPFDKVLQDNFMFEREMEYLFGKSTMTPEGKSTWVSRSTNREIRGGDGLIAQISRYAGKYAANNITVTTFQTIILQMIQRCDKSSGNDFLFTCNESMYAIIQRVMADFLAHNRTDGTYLWSKEADGKVKIGAEYNSYTYMGNTITFKPDKTLSREYNYPIGLCLDLTWNEKKNKPAMEMFTVKGKEYMPYFQNGPGGKTGKQGGEVSTLVAGYIAGIMGYSGLACYNPYKSFILTAQR